MTDIDMLTENSWDAEREEARAHRSDMGAREDLLRDVERAKRMVADLPDTIRIESVDVRVGTVWLNVPSFFEANVASRFIGAEKYRSQDGTSRHVHSIKYGLDVWVTSHSDPETEKAALRERLAELEGEVAS